MQEIALSSVSCVNGREPRICWAANRHKD